MKANPRTRSEGGRPWFSRLQKRGRRLRRVRPTALRVTGSTRSCRSLQPCRRPSALSALQAPYRGGRREPLGYSVLARRPRHWWRHALLRLAHLRPARGQPSRPEFLEHDQEGLHQRAELLQRRRGLLALPPHPYPRQQRHRPGDPPPSPLHGARLLHRPKQAAEVVGEGGFLDHSFSISLQNKIQLAHQTLIVKD